VDGFQRAALAGLLNLQFLSWTPILGSGLAQDRRKRRLQAPHFQPLADGVDA
jgi:hypothetical protein